MSRYISRTRGDLSNACRDVQDVRSKQQSTNMDMGRNQRADSGVSSTSCSRDNSINRKNTSETIFRLCSFLKTNKNKLIPLALLSPLFLQGCSAKDLYDVLELKDHVDITKESYERKVDFIGQILYFVSNVILATPVFLFDNEWLSKMIYKTCLFSAGTVTVLTMVEGIKRMLNLHYTPLKQIIVRFPIALAVSAFSPYLFIKGIKGLNYLTDLILKFFKSQFGMIGDSKLLLAGEIDTAFLLLFTVVFLILSVPIIFYAGRRWFDLIALSVTTPLAMTAWIFNSFNHFFTKWKNALINLSTIQLVYAAFFTLLSFIMFAVPFPPTFEGSLAKLILMVGGMWRLAFPPQFVKSMVDKGESSLTMIDQLKKHMLKLKVLGVLKK